VTIEFSDCALNTGRRELTRDGEPVAIEPKTLDLLIYLINNRDRAIGKDELQDKVWGTIVSDTAMTRAVMKLRKAVGDKTGEAKIIKTVPRFGYRFVAPVRASAGGGATADPKRPGIAVLPLDNMSGDPENNYFGDGIAEEILNLLAKIPALRVASRTSAFAFRGSRKTVREIAENLGVNILLEGSVRKAGNRVRITMQLIDAEADAHLWSEIYDREITDIFTVQAEVAREVVSAIARGAAGNIRIYEATDSPSAYDFYLRGMDMFHVYDRGSQHQAREMFRRAVEIDPGFARAWAALANSSCLLFMWWEASDEHLRTADDASKRATELAPDLAETQTSRAFTLTLLDDYEAAFEGFERALKLDPLLWEAWYLYARSQWAYGDLARAAALFVQAATVRPEDYQAPSLAATAFLTSGDKKQSDRYARMGVERVEAHLDLNPGDTRALGLGACNLRQLGEYDRGVEWLEKSLQLAPDDIPVLHMAGCFYGAAGEVDKALDYFERRFELGDAYMDWVDNDSDFDSVRDHPRFRAMVKNATRKTTHT
jgi:adenylate cyclase